jgi:hypothetical protein
MNFPRFLLLSLLLGASAPVLADVSSSQLAQVVSSLPASGTIEIDPQGNVAGYTIRKAEAYDAAVLDLLDRNITRWKFKPVLVDGVARQARFDMYLRLEARPLDEKRYQVEIASAAFGRQQAAAPHTEIETRNRRALPGYPRDEFFDGVGAKVIAVLRIDRSGKVQNVTIEQTNLKAVGKDGAMQSWRDAFEEATTAALRRWTFTPPTVGPSAAEDHWAVRVPVNFIPQGAKAEPEPGQWESYVPGPRNRVSWARDGELADSGVDTLPGGGIYPMEQPLHLLTKLNPE